MFSPQTVQKDEETLCKLAEKEESMQLGLRHILHRLDEAKDQWTSSMDAGDGRTSSRSALKHMLQDLDRICDLEENRLLGFPRGERGERGGAMPVYWKRAELSRWLSGSAHCAAVVTAGT
eukprot:2214686-Rhodomonas_salina.1